MAEAAGENVGFKIQVQSFEPSAHEVKFFKNSADFFQSLQKSPSANSVFLASCRGGIERSHEFNQNMPDAGLRIAKINQNIDPDSLFINHHGNGIPLQWVPGMLLDAQTQITNQGIKIPELSDPINQFVFIIQNEDTDSIQRIARSMQKLKDRNHGKLPVSINIVFENNVPHWKEAVTNFVKTRTAQTP